jgi:hypothetical protein
MSKKDKLWFEGQENCNILFTKEDLMIVLKALEEKSGGFLAKDWNEFDKVKSRIYFQMRG